MGAIQQLLSCMDHSSFCWADVENEKNATQNSHPPGWQPHQRPHQLNGEEALTVLSLRSSPGQATVGFCYSYDVMGTARRTDLLLLSPLQNGPESLCSQLCGWANRLVDVRRQEEAAGFGTIFRVFWVDPVLISLLGFVPFLSHGSLTESQESSRSWNIAGKHWLHVKNTHKLKHRTIHSEIFSED